MAETRTKKEIELSEKKLATEIHKAEREIQKSEREDEIQRKKQKKELEKLEAETRRTQLELAEAERDERDAKACADENRVYNFVSVVKGDSVKTAINVLNAWARRNDDPITIVFNSPGGGVFDGLALYDAILAIKQEGIEVNTVCRGMAASMGGILFQAGDTRTIGKNAYVLIHEVSDIAIGTTSELEDELKFTKRVQARLVGILAERSTMSEKEIERKWRKTDWWLDAAETVELGFADEIG